MSKQSQLQMLMADITKAQVCPELAEQATQMVFGEGSADADVVFIGEAPGKSEDLQGRPFVGASGRLLDQMLASIGLERKDVYITNIVKYRPPANRDPKTSEKQSFLPYLIKQLTIINPKLIVTLGRHSMDCLLPGLKISDAHGTLHAFEKIACLPLFHPAAALYNGSLKQTLFDDFAAIPAVLKKISK